MKRTFLLLFFANLFLLQGSVFAQCGFPSSMIVSVNGNSSTCQGAQSLILRVSGTQTGVEYTMYGEPHGYTVMQMGGSTLTWDVTAASADMVGQHQYKVVARARNGGCTQQIGTPFIVTENPAFNPTISVSGSGCSTKLTGSVAKTYAWRYKSSSGPIISAASAIFPKQGGTYYLTATNACGTTKTVSRAVSTIAAIGITASGSTTSVCPGSITLTATGGSSYSWKAPNGTISGGGSIVVNATGTYTLTGSNLCGIQETATRSVTVKGVATNPVVQNRRIKSNTATTMTASGAGTNESYNWYNSSGSLVKQGASFTTPALVVNTAYSVSKYATNNTTCESGRVPFQVLINKAPTVSAGADKTLIFPAHEVILEGAASDPEGIRVNLVQNRF